MIQRLRYSWKAFRLWLRWRKKAKQEVWPYIYTGPPTYGLKTGAPLRRAHGQKAAAGGARYYSRDNVVRILNQRHVRKA